MTSARFDHFDSELEDFSTYVERLEQFFIVNDTKPEHKAAVLITVIGRKTYGILKNLILPESPKDKSYAVLVELLKQHFQPVRITIAERFKFYKRTQHSGEPISSFILDLKRLAASCDFGAFLNEALRDAFVCGLCQENIQKKLLSEQDLSFESACKIALAMDLASTESSKFHAKSTLKSHAVVEVDNISRNHSLPAKLKGKGTTKPGSRQPKSENYCSRCGRSNHTEHLCPAKNWKCFTCQRLGHTSKMCRSEVTAISTLSFNTQVPTSSTVCDSNVHSPCSPRISISQDEKQELSSSSDIEDFVSRLNNVSIMKESQEPLVIQALVGNIVLNMEVDTGAAVSLVPDKLYYESLSSIPLQPTKIRLNSVIGDNVNVLGELSVRVTCQNQVAERMPLVVAEGINTSLLGRSWLSVLAPSWKQELLERIQAMKKSSVVISQTTSDGMEKIPYLDQLKRQFPNVFDENLDQTITGYQAHIHVRENAKPLFLKAYPVPYALVEKVEAELQKLEQKKIIVPVTQSDWASPIVVVPKANSTNIRLCVDFKRTVNQVVTTEHYPLPKIDDILATLANGKVFTVLDLANAYQQLEVSPESRELLTINTHKGLFQFTRLPFGISCAPAIFQRVMDNILSGIPQACCYLDDVLVTGSDEADLKQHVSLVMERLAHHNVKININKCRFLATSVEYLGHLISAEGVRPTGKNSEAILRAPAPTNVTQLRSYLGMVNFYSKFIPNLATELKPLYDLLGKKVSWIWSKQCEGAFETSKRLIQEHSLLVHYDPSKPLYLTCDASAYGLGAVLSHKEGNIEYPILFASTTLTPTEQKYAQIEREALALVFGVNRFHKYLWGRKFYLITDHQPLQYIFSENKGIPALSAARIQRWALTLSSYDYTIRYRKGSELVLADALSRLPIEENRISVIRSFSFCNELPVTASDVATATEQDPVLKEVVQYTVHGWPDGVRDIALKPYWMRRNDISLEQKCLLWGNRVIIPRELRQKVLLELHSNHPGVVRMKMQARSYFWWPGLDSDIETESSHCITCQLNQDMPPKCVGTWSTSSCPWERIHLDLAWLQGTQFLTVADSFSKWIDVYVMNTTTTQEVIKNLRKSFSYLGLPRTIVTDNGSQFVSSEFKFFCDKNGIELIQTPTYHPSSNGQVERAIRSVKSALKKRRYDYPGEDPAISIEEILFTYRNTPCTSTGVSPAALMFKHKPRIILDVLRPVPAQEKKHVGITTAEYRVGQNVLVRSVRNQLTKWWPGRVLEVRSPATYLVSVKGKTRFVHRDHLRPSRLPSEMH